MNQLWEDLRAHVLTGSQTERDASQYFLGAMVVDQHEDEKHLVDGQQRFTTMTLISCAIRDALICTGFMQDAHDIQHKLIVNTNVKLADKKNRFELLDIPEQDPRSSEFQIAPYRKRLTNIRTGLVTKRTEKGEKDFMIDIS